MRLKKKFIIGWILAGLIILSFFVGRYASRNCAKIFHSANVITTNPEKLEEKLQTEPDNLQVRIKLLNYYFRNRFKSEDARAKRQEHVLWVIKHHPEAEIAGRPQAILDPVLDGVVYQVAKDLWLKQVEAYGRNINVIMNAAKYFAVHDTDISIKLLNKLQKIEQDNPKIYMRLAHMYSLKMRHTYSKDLRTKFAKQALVEYEKALKTVKNKLEKFYILPNATKAAFEAGEYKKAELMALELLSESQDNKNDWNYGNAVHHGNLILGRISLQKGEIEKAKEFLMKAGETPGSPQLNSFGPNMTLARELLEKGEKEIVLKYLKKCSKFWKCDRGRLQKWGIEIENGEIPEFGANLYY